jgi:hypothetical protein
MASSTAGVSLGDVGAGVGSVPAVDDGAADVPPVDVGPADGVVLADDVAVADGVVPGVGVAVGVDVAEPAVPVGVGVDEAEDVGVGVAVGVLDGGGVGEDDVDAFSGWHREITGLAFTLPPEELVTPLARVAARLAGATAVETRNPVVVAKSTPPARRLSETGRTGRTRAKHIEGPARTLGCLVYLAGLPRLVQPLTLDNSPLLGGSHAIGERCLMVSLGKIHSITPVCRRYVTGTPRGAICE